MKILYGVSGEGFGHSSRAKVIISHLKKKKHEVLVLTYGQALKPLSKFKPIKIPGIHLYFNKQGNLSLFKTTKESLKSYISSLSSFKKIKSIIDKFNPDICISDFEPLVPIISYWRSLPLISIDNQHMLTHFKIKISKKHMPSYKLAKLATNLCVSKADAFLILSFIKQRSKKKNTYIVSPILRPEIIKLISKNNGHILVYTTKPSPDLMRILKSFPQKFIVYGQNKSSKEANIQYKLASQNFIKDLAKSKAVIASAGFTLISESLYLKKPYFAIPLKGQFEQTINALFIKKTNVGSYSEAPSKIQIKNFLNNLSKYQKNINKQIFNPNEAVIVLDKILSDIKKNVIYNASGKG